VEKWGKTAAFGSGHSAAPRHQPRRDVLIGCTSTGRKRVKIKTKVATSSVHFLLCHQWRALSSLAQCRHVGATRLPFFLQDEFDEH